MIDLYARIEPGSEVLREARPSEIVEAVVDSDEPHEIIARSVELAMQRSYEQGRTDENAEVLAYAESAESLEALCVFLRGRFRARSR